MKIYVHGKDHLADITRYFLLDRHIICSPQEAEIVWCCEDTPIRDDEADVRGVIDDILGLTLLNQNAVYLVSSQLPVGSVRRMEDTAAGVRFACCPENFRYRDDWRAYLNQARFVIGTRRQEDRDILEKLFVFAKHIEWMTVESAEMTKHAINAYLGMCISFINEIGDVCDVVGADILEVERGLTSDPRVSSSAPLHAGAPFGLGHLDRDLSYIRSILPTALIAAIQDSNHKRRP